MKRKNGVSQTKEWSFEFDVENIIKTTVIVGSMNKLKFRKNSILTNELIDDEG